jgi:hypothetical protein
LIAAQAQRAVDFTNHNGACIAPATPQVYTILDQRQLGPTETACFDYTTIVDELAAKSLP